MTIGIQGYTREEIREFMHEYYLQPPETKTVWLAARQVPDGMLRRWRKLVFEGDLDRNLIPRDHGGMARTSGERSALEKARAKEIAKHQSEVEKLKKRIAELEGTNSALGKAIGLLHELSVPGPDTTPTNDRNGS